LRSEFGSTHERECQNNCSEESPSSTGLTPLPELSVFTALPPFSTKPIFDDKIDLPASVFIFLLRLEGLMSFGSFLLLKKYSTAMHTNI